MPRTFKTVGFLFALLLCMVHAPGANASAIGPENGFLTLFNETTGEHILVTCIDGRVTEVSAIIDGRLTKVGVSIGTPCSPDSFEGFEVEFNIDARSGGWVIHPEGYLGEQTRSAYACTDDGAAFAIISANNESHSFSREGGCMHGSVPG